MHTLACGKYSSNVVQACLMGGSKEQRRAVIEALCSPSYTLHLATHVFGNHVMQNALAVAEPDQRARLNGLLVPSAEGLRANVYGQHVERALRMPQSELLGWVEERYTTMRGTA